MQFETGNERIELAKVISLATTYEVTGEATSAVGYH